MVFSLCSHAALGSYTVGLSHQHEYLIMAEKWPDMLVWLSFHEAFKELPFREHIRFFIEQAPQHPNPNALQCTGNPRVFIELATNAASTLFVRWFHTLERRFYTHFTPIFLYRAGIR